MKKPLLSSLFLLLVVALNAGEVKKTFSFSNHNIEYSGLYSKVSFDGTILSGIPGEPALPYKSVSLILPPGEKAISIEITGSGEQLIPGSFQLYPLQYAQPISKAVQGEFVKNEKVYAQSHNYPSVMTGHLMTEYLHGYAFALSTFTPVIYQPSTGKVTYYSSVTVTIRTAPDVASTNALQNVSSSASALKRVRALAQNTEMISLYPQKKAAATGYQMLIITPSQFDTGYNKLINYYNTIGITTQIASTQDINSNGTGQDLQEKIRNYIIQEYQTNQIEYVLLGGDIEHVPYRGFYCYVISGSGYSDNNIPADIYYSGLDGNWNTNGDAFWAEPGEEDALPEVSVSRLPFSNMNQLSAIINKTVSYQKNPVTGEWREPYMVSEHLYDDPMTFGSAYLDLLVDYHTENGYSTFGIPSATNDIAHLEDSLISPGYLYQWQTDDVIEGINEGKTFIHHVGHSMEVYMMRLYVSDITDQNFSMVNGVDHNFTLMYTHGCLCGAFDFNDCIAEAAININNFLVGGVFNSRYGWFNQGTNDGPSTHLHREFISAMYNDTVPETHLGTAHMISKIMTAPFLALPGEFEPGAQRWCFYDCNAFGDPALNIWTDEPTGTGILPKKELAFTIYPVPAKETATLRYTLSSRSSVRVTLVNEIGQVVKTFELKSQEQGANTLTMDVSDLTQGIYFCRMETSGNMATNKMIVVR